ncbi:leucine rich repeat domain containing protein [Sporothrix brasiliensis 5110]|uniref:Leucine rich repeat domain containing protein n=1 Tax=Sporothrix brasiliensis 5110 TaxID=1398154 RepID=A0A0C2EY48_9PEZI|nr:leucine rich repeat domain containing protein [Sporothrix brasiliensis 5110]KIH91619.1 leucine rich repeat domain containing protein [Sporothrix brasiliensis 5110]
MSDEPSLPRMPPFRAADSIFGPNRKRGRLFDGNGSGSASGSGSHQLSAHQLLLNNSSDPAVFSSDDDPALDNYALPDPTGAGHPRIRKKKRYVGAWFAQHPASTDSTFDEDPSLQQQDRERDQGQREPQTMTLPLLSSPVRPRPSKKRRTFERQFDSGVWMGKEGIAEGADGAEGDEDMLEAAMAESPPPPSQSSTSSQLSLAPPPAAPLQTDFPPPPPRQRRVFQRVPSLAVNSAEEKARKIVQECIEAGDDKISLIGLGLTALSNATVEPLSGLVPFPVVTEGVAFEQRDPKLKLFLSSNNLVRLPGALFQLQHLTVLSLRGNGLTELPPAIGQLRNLKSLNVSLNKLQSLPAELLPLIRTYGQGGRLTELLVHPNPYFSPEEEVEDNNTLEAVPRPARHVGDRPTRVARSPVHYMDSWGKTWSSFTLDPAALGACNLIPTEDMAIESVPPVESTTVAAATSRVPTLVSLAMEACYRTPQLPQLPDLLPPEAPPRLARQLGKALAVRDSGGSTCSVCSHGQGQLATRRPMVAPMTAWLEWWEFGKPDVNVTYTHTAAVSGSTGAAAAASTIGGGGAGGADTPQPARLQENEIEVLPFMWRGCSWGCVPRVKVVEKDEDEEDER